MSKRTKRRGRGEGSIFERADGRWCAKATLPDGRAKAIYGKTRKEVATRLTELLAAIEKGLPVGNDRITVGQYLETWLEQVAKPRLKPATFVSYTGLVQHHLIPRLGVIPLTKLQPPQIRAALTELLESGRKPRKGEKLSEGKALSPRRVAYAHAVLRASLEDALRDGLVQRNVAALVSPPRGKGREIEPLTPEQTRQFLAAIEGHRLEALFTVAAALGVRQGEALALRWQDIDFEQSAIAIRGTLSRIPNRPEGIAWRIDTPKTRAGNRTLLMPALLRSALLAHRDRQAIERTSAWTATPMLVHGEPEDVSDLVFTTERGQPIDGSSLTHLFQRILSAAGLPNKRFHDLRHGAATMLLVQRIPARAVQAALGWDQPSMLSRYSHFVDESRQQIADSLDAVLNPRKTAQGVNEGVKRTGREVQ